MAKQIIHKLIDDLDGGDAEETVKFAPRRHSVRDRPLRRTPPNCATRLAPYVGGRLARSARGGVVVGGRAARGRGGAAADREQNKAIRAWAKKAGKDISDRGRIPQEIVDQYHAKAGR